MGKIIDRVRERESKRIGKIQREWIADAENKMRESQRRSAEMLRQQRNVLGEIRDHSIQAEMLMNMNMNMFSGAAFMGAGASNSEEAKSWNSQSVDHPQHPTIRPWWAFW